MSNLDLIKQANEEMLSYFNNSFLESLETIQELKTQVFEVEVKIDELERTKNIYAFKSTSRKSVFTPTISDDVDNERGKIIENQIEDLESVKDSLINKIHNLEMTLSSAKKRLTLLNNAGRAIKELSLSLSPDIEETFPDESEFEFVQESSTDDISRHGHTILMQDAFDKAFYSTLIERNIKDGIISLNHKLEMLSYLLSTDMSRAKLTLQDITQNSKKILDSVQDINSKLETDMNSSQPIWNKLDDFIMLQREQHPECVINTNIECIDDQLNLHPVFTINLLKLLNMFFDNIYKHANANSIDFKIIVSKNIIDVSIADNGVGIDPDYLTKSPWYSSLHKAHEVIYLLGGTLNITGNIISGTQVKFNYSVHE